MYPSAAVCRWDCGAGAFVPENRPQGIVNECLWRGEDRSHGSDAAGDGNENLGCFGLHPVWRAWHAFEGDDRVSAKADGADRPRSDPASHHAILCELWF